jgi:hypothetical protein
MLHEVGMRKPSRLFREARIQRWAVALGFSSITLAACTEPTAPKSADRARAVLFSSTVVDVAPTGPQYDWSKKRYGNWCGPQWSGGVEGSIGSGPAVDTLDKLCRRHDLAYNAADLKSGPAFLNAATKPEENRICKVWNDDFEAANKALSSAALAHIPLAQINPTDAPDGWGYDPRIWGVHPWTPESRIVYKLAVAELFKKYPKDLTFTSQPECKNKVKSVAVTPSSLQLEVGDIFQLHAVVRDDDGVIMKYTKITMNAGNSPVVSISNDGDGTAVAPGTALVTVASDKKFAIATITVTPKSNPTPQFVTAVSFGPELLRYSEGFLYFTSGTGTLDRQISGVRPDGPETRSAGLVGPVQAMATVRDSVYWSSNYSGDRTIRKNPLIGGTGQGVTQLIDNMGTLIWKADCFESDGFFLYFIGEDGFGQYAIRKVSLDGSSNTNLAPISGQGACALSEGQVFYADRTTGDIRRVATNGLSPSVSIATNVPFQLTPGRLFVYGANVILTDGQTIRTVSLASGQVTTRFNDGSPYTNAVISGSTLYLNRRVAGNYPDFQATGGCVRLSLDTWASSLKPDVGCEAVSPTELFWWDRSPPDNSGYRGWWLLKVPK